MRFFKIKLIYFPIKLPEIGHYNSMVLNTHPTTNEFYPTFSLLDYVLKISFV